LSESGIWEASIARLGSFDRRPVLALDPLGSEHCQGRAVGQRALPGSGHFRDQHCRDWVIERRALPGLGQWGEVDYQGRAIERRALSELPLMA
jgi:hypothetical protein